MTSNLGTELGAIVDAKSALIAAVIPLRLSVGHLDNVASTVPPAIQPHEVQLAALAALDWAQEAYNNAERALLAARTLLSAADAAVAAAPAEVPC